MTQPLIHIEGAGIAGQVLNRELFLRGIPSRVTDRVSFPRDKVCGGVLQWGSWEYLKATFEISEPVRMIRSISHFWKGKKISNFRLPQPMVYVSRCVLDHTLFVRQQSTSSENGYELRVNAKGVSPESGEWIGFQGNAEPVEELQMHYGRGVCAGVSPTLENQAHLAFIVKREHVQNTEKLKKYLWDELRIRAEGPLKGTGRIRYGYSKEPFAIGDAKMTTFPFLGLGMKHAIFSARLFAEKISANDVFLYAKAHRQIFRRWRLFSDFAGKIYDSPFQFLLKPFLRSRFLFFRLFEWLHG